MVAIGVVQEQHPDRTRLYSQWRELDWPIFVDSMNVLDHVTVVPIPMAIDESGIVVHTRFNPRQLAEFVGSDFEAQDIAPDYNRVPESKLDDLAGTPESDRSSRDWYNLGTTLFNYGGPEELGDSIAALRRAARLEVEDGQVMFALGTALRRRYETGYREPGDAQAAVEQWGLALDANPNHYIRRRRLQQYGPRLDKPYNFYFWVKQARKETEARGQTPIRLAAEPMGSEIAQPQRHAEAPDAGNIANPDPRGRINRDKKNLVGIEALVTPGRVRPGHRVRARLTFRLNEKSNPLWNNEADDLESWVGLPEGIALTEQMLSFPNPETPETNELRQLEFEMEIEESASAGPVTFSGYALYYVCEEEGGVCYYLRNDFEVSFIVDPDAPTLK